MSYFSKVSFLSYSLHCTHREHVYLVEAGVDGGALGEARGRDGVEVFLAAVTDQSDPSCVHVVRQEVVEVLLAALTREYEQLPLHLNIEIHLVIDY